MYYRMLEPFCIVSFLLRKAALVSIHILPAFLQGKVGRRRHPVIDINNGTFVITQFMIATSGREYCTLQVVNWRLSLSLGEVWNICGHRRRELRTARIVRAAPPLLYFSTGSLWGVFVT